MFTFEEAKGETANDKVFRVAKTNDKSEKAKALFEQEAVQTAEKRWKLN